MRATQQYDQTDPSAVAPIHLRWASLVAAIALGACGNSSPPAAAGETPPIAGQGGSVQPAIGAKATAVLEPLHVQTVNNDGEMEVACRGEASLAVTPNGTNLSLTVRACDFKSYPVVIHTAGSCTEPIGPETRWDAPRGEGIPNVTCARSGLGRVYYTRAASDPKPWSIGQPAAADLAGKRLVVHDPDDMRPMACGVIAPIAVEPPPSAATAGIPIELQAVIANQCIWKEIVRESEHECPDPARVVECATTNCELSACLASCSQYLQCLQTSPDACSSECLPDEACSSCQSRMVQCLWGFCADALACAAPVAPGGACSKIEACCHKQGEFAPQCLDLLEKVIKVSGEPSCVGWLEDWDWNTNMAVPCTYED